MDYERMLTTAYDTLRVQIAKALLYFTRGPQNDESPIQVAVRMAQDDVADLLGLSRQSVNRELAPLIRDGVVAWRYGKIEVLDPARLVAIAAEEEPLSPDMERTLFQRSPEHFRTSD